MVKKSLNKDKQQTISCHNIWETSFLVYNKIPFLKTDILNGKIIFHFIDNPEVQNILQKFVMNPDVRLQEYISIFQRIKTIIYQEKKKNEE